MADSLRNDIVVQSETPDTSGPRAAKRLKDKPVLERMRKAFRQCVTGTAHFRENAILDAKFRAGTWGKKSFQWIDDIEAERNKDQRPCLTINRVPGSIHQVTNQARNAHLRIQVNPVDDHGDPKVAEVLQGIIRNIETTSFSDRAYAMASDKQAEQGLGYFRLVTEWADEEGFRQRIKIKREINPLRIYVIPSAEEQDFSDASDAFKVSDIDADTYTSRTGFPAPTAQDIAAFSADGDESGDWFPSGKIRHVEWFAREPRGLRRHIAELSNGKTITYPTDEQKAELLKLGLSVKRDRWVQPMATVWRKGTGLDIDEETVWPADSHPFIPVVGDELLIEGERDWRGVVRDSKDSACVYNVEVSGLVESVGMGQKAPAVGYRGQFGKPDSDMRKAWESANKKPRAFLEVEPMDIDGKPAPMPQPMRFEMPIEATVIAIQQADNDYKITSGWHDASLGERGPQESGKAIVARQRQDELGSSHYLDNLRFAMCSAGRQLIQLIRAVYDAPTVIRITGTDGRQRKVMVFSGKDRDPRQAKFLQNHPQTGQPVPFALPEGVKEIYDLGVGEFDIEVSTGPSPGSRRQEDLQVATELFKNLPPELAAKFMDLQFQLIDTPVGRQMSERAKKMLPPELQDQDEEGGEAIPPQVAMQMQQMKAKLQEAMQAIQIAQREIEGEGQKLRAQAEMAHQEQASRERMKAMELRVRLLEQQRDIKAEQVLTLLQAELDRLALQAQQSHEHGLAAFDAAESERDRRLTAGMAAAKDAATIAAAKEGAADAPEADAGA